MKVQTSPHWSISLPRTIAATFVGFLSLVLIFRLEGAPPPWWDEGWTLNLARNWVEKNHYGQFSAGAPQTPGLAAASSIILPSVGSFMIFGVGVWQGRLVGVIYTLGALAAIYSLAKKLYSREAALASLFALLMMIPHPMINPLLVGRQVLADIPAVFFLLVGYLLLLQIWQKPLVYAFLPAIPWAVALNTKVQTLPFWFAGMAVPLMLAVVACRDKRTAWRLGIISLTTLGLSQLLLGVQGYLLRDVLIPQVSPPGLYEIVALVTDPRIRLESVQLFLFLAAPTVLGLGHSILQAARALKTRASMDLAQLTGISLLALAGSWLAWYVLLSNGGVRYLATPVFIAGIFVGKMLSDFTAGFNLRDTVQRGAAFLKLKLIDRSGAKALAAILLVVPLTAATVFVLYATYRGADRSVQDTAQFINTRTAPDSLIESYDAELFFLLERDYHYPPDQYHVLYLRRYLLEPELGIVYDPLAADPDYLVVGQLSADWRVYDQVLAAGEFRLIETFPRYQVYERVRE